MKALAWVSIFFGLGSAGASGYSIVETYPNLKAFREMAEAGRERASAVTRALDEDLLRSYASSVDLQHYIAWGAGGVAIILGAVALTKGSKLGIAGIVLGLVGLVGSLMTGTL